MTLKNEDIERLILACHSHMAASGSEYIWDEYDQLIKKLKTYREQHSTNFDLPN